MIYRPALKHPNAISVWERSIIKAVITFIWEKIWVFLRKYLDDLMERVWFHPTEKTLRYNWPLPLCCLCCLQLCFSSSFLCSSISFTFHLSLCLLISSSFFLCSHISSSLPYLLPHYWSYLKLNITCSLTSSPSVSCFSLFYFLVSLWF